MEICMMHARNVRFMQNTLWFSREGLKVKDIHLHRYRNLHMPKWFASSRSANKGGRQYRRYDTDPDSVVCIGDIIKFPSSTATATAMSPANDFCFKINIKVS